MNKLDRLTLFVSSPNNYEDIFKIFYLCFRKYWKDCPYNFILSTNNQKYNHIEVINNYKDNDGWTDRTYNVIKNIKSKYILLFCDDIFIIDYVDCDKIEKILDYMDDNCIKFCRLKPVKKGKRIRSIPYLSRVNKQLPSAINLQYGIFEKEFLIELLGDGDLTAWEIEKKLNNDILNAKDELFEDVIACNKHIIRAVHGVSKGKWFPTAINTLKKNDICIIPERSVMPIYIEIKQKIVSEISVFLSPKKRRKIKKIMSKLGWSFMTEN